MRSCLWRRSVDYHYESGAELGNLTRCQPCYQNYLNMSWRRSSRGSPFGILEVKRGGIDRCDPVWTVFAKDFGTKDGVAKEDGTGLGVGETPSSTLVGDADSSLRAGVKRPSSLGVFESFWLNNCPSEGVCLSVWGVSDRVVLGDPGVVPRSGPPKGNPENRDCSKFFLHDDSISSLRTPKLSTLTELPRPICACGFPGMILAFSWFDNDEICYFGKPGLPFDI